MQSITWNNSLLDRYFDDQTMSVHFKAECPILKKKGKPGDRKSEVGDQIVSKEELEHMISELYIEIREFPESRLEIDRKYSKVAQIWPYRIVIVHEPLSDGLEVTVVKPVKKLSLSDYQLSSDVLELLLSKAQGILISGSPGSGKTTFAQALIEKFVQQNKIIKTIESPRDLLVDTQVVQYSFSYAPHSEIRDILLLSRPDVAVYDEVRNVEDFQLFKDLRLTGIGLIGVIHATAPVDSIQRFIGTIEMGIIPQVIDTVIYIDKGWIQEVLQLKQVVKMPSGMMSADLARPVIEVTSFLENKLKYEIYTFGEQVVVMPLDQIVEQEKGKKNIVFDAAAAGISQIMDDMFGFPVECEIIWPHNIRLTTHSSNKWKIIWTWWSVVQELEKKFGVRIDVETNDEMEWGLKPTGGFGGKKFGGKKKRR